MSVSSASRRVISELNSLLERQVIIRLKNGKVLKGTLYGFDERMNVLLKGANEEGGSSYPVMLIMAESIESIASIESPMFNPEEFARVVVSRLNIRDADVKAYPEAGVLVVLNSIRVSEKGVEGSGPLAHKIYGLFTEYMESKKKETSQLKA
ncbi:MAG: Sm ribonucleo [Desulfurococcales archaeon]|jgi:small nuclear ribonucleoprotein (snRNP)-like protein|nr:Sm ribonucleo [Desulfurococcales archaeon]